VTALERYTTPPDRAIPVLELSATLSRALVSAPLLDGKESLLRRSRSALLLSAAIGAALALGAPVASAAKGPAKTAAEPVALTAAQQCAVADSSTLFAAWGDQNLYTPFQGSTFENGGAGWSWSGGASIVSDDDRLLTTAGSHSMQIPGGATATSPPICTDSTMPSMRFFIRRISGTGNLTITGTVGNGKNAYSAALGTVSGSATWAPTPQVVFPSYLATIVGTGSLNAQFLFSTDKGTTFRIDDVAMDPYRRT
jgi:hypothetical protein